MKSEGVRCILGKEPVMTFVKGLRNCSSTLALLGAVVGFGGIAQAQDVKTEPRLRKAFDLNTYGSATLASANEVKNLLQPWWPKEVYMPYAELKDSLNKPFYGKVKPVTAAVGGRFFTLENPDVPANTAPAAAPTPNPAGFNGKAIIFGTTHAASANKDWDKDEENDQDDQCPGDPEKVAPGKCGCGYIDTRDDALCSDPEGAAPTTDGESDNAESLRLLDMKVRGGKRQFRTKATSVRKLKGGGARFNVELSFALPRFASADDFFIEANEDLGENAFRSPDADELDTFFGANLSEEGDKVTYKCSINKNVKGAFKSVQLAKFKENNGKPVVSRLYAFPNATVKLSKVETTDEWRFRCVATNQNTGSAQEFFSKPFKLDFVNKSGIF
jgi:hypothetical protein